MPELTCTDCGRTFTPSASLQERFPGWTPSRCASCHRAATKGGAGAGGGRAGGGARAGGARAGGARAGGARAGGARAGGAQPGGRRQGGGEDHRTLAQVLERYHDGPQDGVFTDGSAIPNPGPGGWGAVYVRDGEVIAQDHGHEPQTTNNRMELRALDAAIDLVPPGTPARIHTDSNLAVRTLTEWAAGWQRRGWKRRTGPVENLDLVRPLYERLQQRPELELVWIKAHAGNRWNEYADALATAWARAEL